MFKNYLPIIIILGLWLPGVLYADQNIQSLTTNNSSYRQFDLSFKYSTAFLNDPIFSAYYATSAPVFGLDFTWSFNHLALRLDLGYGMLKGEVPYGNNQSNSAYKNDTLDSTLNIGLLSFDILYKFLAQKSRPHYNFYVGSGAGATFFTELLAHESQQGQKNMIPANSNENPFSVNAYLGAEYRPYQHVALALEASYHYYPFPGELLPKVGDDIFNSSQLQHGVPFLGASLGFCF